MGFIAQRVWAPWRRHQDMRRQRYRMNPIARRHRVVDHIVERLEAIGVDYVFGVDGANIEDLYDAAISDRISPRSWLSMSFRQRRWLMVIAAVCGLGVVCATSGGGV